MLTPEGDDTYTASRIVDDLIGTWDGYRQRAEPRIADDQFRTWLFLTMPEQAGEQDNPDTLAYLAFELACGLFDRGRTADAFRVLGWLGRHFVAHPDGDVAARAVMALTDTCVGRLADTDTNAHARHVLHEVIDAAREPADVRLARALCRAQSTLGQLRTHATAPPEGKAEELVVLWRELARRGGGEDPELRGWRAHGLGNEALVSLQLGRDDETRRLFTTLLAEVAADPPGRDPDVDVWRARARHALGVLDRFDVGEPALKLDYLERQRYWDQRLRPEIDNHMPAVVERARETHRRSAGVVRSWLCVGEPFVLLLRNFDLVERSGTNTAPWWGGAVEEQGGDYVQEVHFTDAAPAMQELANGVALVHVASTTAGELESNPLLGQFTSPVRLYLPDATWFGIVSTLVSVADQVIVWADRLSPGVARELELLVAAGRTADTLVLLEPARTTPGSALPPPAGEPLTRDHPALAPFPHLTDATDMKDRSVADCPPLVGVVERLDAARAVPPAERLAEIRARLEARPAPGGSGC